MAKKPQLGDIIEAYCERCRLNLDASIAAMEGEEVKQVQCRTCGNFVKFREPVPESERKERVFKRVLNMRDRRGGTRGGTPTPPPVTEKPSTPFVPRRKPVDPRWIELTEGVDSTRATPYDPLRTYSEGDYILHKEHGMGHVERLEGDQMVVLFRLGETTLPFGQDEE